ncbi:lysozyme C-like [Rhinoderma darwinii]|uniref:lysozyme C-like n=1 Tax=Rhinoderma darwinii TaxID=43563 RepID=UPI003F670E89
MAMRGLFIVSLLVLAIDCVVLNYDAFYDRCKLIQELNDAGVVGIKGYTVGDYVCLVKHISGYDSSLHTSDSEYGIFQINSWWWCDDGKTVGRKNLCGVQCSELLDKNITNDIQCFARILKDPNGLEAWSVWPTKCQDKDLSEFTRGLALLEFLPLSSTSSQLKPELVMTMEERCHDLPMTTALLNL